MGGWADAWAAERVASPLVDAHARPCRLYILTAAAYGRVVELAGFLAQVRGWIGRLGLSVEDAALRIGMAADELERTLDGGDRGPPLHLVFRILDGLDLRLAGVEAGTPAELVQYLEQRRDAMHVSKRKLAGKAGVDRANLNALLRTKTPDPKLETVIKLANALAIELRIEERPAETSPTSRATTKPIDAADENAVDASALADELPRSSEREASSPSPEPEPEPEPASTRSAGETDELRTELEDLRDRLRLATDQHEATQRELETARDELEALRQSTGELEDLRAELEDLRGRLGLATDRYEEAQRELEAAREEPEELLALRGLHAETKREAATLREQLTVAHDEIEDLRRQRDEAEDRRSRAARELGATTGLGQKLAAAERDQARLRQQGAAQALQIKELSERLGEAKRTADEAQRERASVKSALAGASGRAAALEKEIEALRKSKAASDKKVSHLMGRVAKCTAEIIVQRRHMAPVDPKQIDKEVEAYLRSQSSDDGDT